MADFLRGGGSILNFRCDQGFDFLGRGLSRMGLKN